MTYDDAGERWVPDGEAGDNSWSNFQKVLDVIWARENSLSWKDVAAETGDTRTPRGTSGTDGSNTSKRPSRLSEQDQTQSWFSQPS